MGAMGRFIDSDAIGDAGRDRLIEATEWVIHIWWHDNAGCLVGHACDMVRRQAYWHNDTDKLYPTLCGVSEAHAGFDRAVARFGEARVTRAIKARAARSNAIDTSTPVAVSSESQFESLTLVGV